VSTLSGKRYYERLAESPNKALEAVALRRNFTLEELQERIANIHATASLEALEKADLASLRAPEEAPPTKANEVSQASKQKLENTR
jgi:hypothetical protein